ncbi:MAG: hypothetical protein WDO71_08285 [Bacteroidota bacterium]
MARDIRTILYYPTIDIPSNSWLRHALLYWDEVSSIIPNTINIEEELSRDIHFILMKDNLKPARPEDLINREGGFEILRKFETEFTTIVQSDQYKRLLAENHILSQESNLKN